MPPNIQHSNVPTSFSGAGRSSVIECSPSGQQPWFNPQTIQDHSCGICLFIQTRHSHYIWLVSLSTDRLPLPLSSSCDYVLQNSEVFILESLHSWTLLNKCSLHSLTYPSIPLSFTSGMRTSSLIQVQLRFNFFSARIFHNLDMTTHLCDPSSDLGGQGKRIASSSLALVFKNITDIVVF